ncbi:adenylate/guanylate cyclase domain-containing protein [Actinomycetospora termitidis]|uniref:Adenylate/guanylate cyclase domain-containing protein n=1 Tax=Actinomycetospora termitidis TaxID=3053470 RepID=A0ABT7M4X0_9PSEU|nr:adenylate/guanylate cyclase domain-containing protein [Actinomycetospora sp. Odt1-22]MDL5155704.1 adenylate/guanylate cyclase domain-containing protein [Actinomycetospora sp. Odt1-22]
MTTSEPAEPPDGSDHPVPDDGSEPAATRMDRLRAAAARGATRAQELDRSPALQRAVKRLRDALPGDAHFGDPLSLGGARHTEAAGRAIVGLTGDRPGVTRELGLGGVQVWQSVLERLGRGGGEHEVTLVFTDLVEFSRWSLAAGDDEVLRVLRQVGEAWEPPMTERAGTVVKRLGDGLMVAFADPRGALDAVVEARRRLGRLHVPGWSPRMRAGLHLGRPRRVGGDYLGVAVNVAARLGDAGRADEILASGEFLGRLDARTVTARRRRRLNLKGVPDGLEVYGLEPADG